MLVFDHVSKRYPNGYDALSDVSLSVDAGDSKTSKITISTSEIVLPIGNKIIPIHLHSR